MNNTVRINRLTKLAELLESLKPGKHFDMETWGEHNADEPPHLDKNGKPGCGSVACALGWAACLPSFRKAGLKVEYADGVYGNPVWVPTYKGFTGEIAGAEFFGIDWNEAYDLFVPDNMDQTPKQVARNVRKLIKAYQK